MPKVLNKRKDKTTKNSVYIGRPSKWGNPFSHLENTKAEFKVSDRKEAVFTYEDWLLNGDGQHLLNDLNELKGKDLVCWCSPLACHGDILIRLANKDD